MNKNGVVIFGGGPAGATAALSLARAGCRVAVLTRESAESNTVGETLSPEACSLLSSLGVWQNIALHARPTSGIWSAWGSRGIVARDFVVHPLGSGSRVSPHRLSTEMLCLAQDAGAKVIAAAATNVDIVKSEDGWTIDTPSGTYRPEFVVDATGRSAAIARRLGGRHVVADRTIAVVARLHPTEIHADGGDVLLLESAACGWWYSTTLVSGELIVGWLSDADTLRGCRNLQKVWSAALNTTDYTGCRTAAFQLDRIFARDASCGRLDPPCGHRWLAIGDAASTVDPLSGSGIYRALQDGLWAARAISDALCDGESHFHAHQEKTRREFESSLQFARGYYRMEHRWPDSPFWQRRSGWAS